MTAKVDPERAPWTIDLHMHTWASPDCSVDPRDLVARARDRGLSRIAVTDHNLIDGALAARALDPDLVIVGEEIETETGGELIAYFLTESIPAGLPAEEVIRLLRAQGALISVSHPFDRLRSSAMGTEGTLAIIDRVDALEVYNARCLLPVFNRRAEEVARRHGKLRTAGSDAHTLAELGAAYLSLPPFRDDPASFRASLAKARAVGRLTGVIPHLASTSAKLRKRSG